MFYQLPKVDSVQKKWLNLVRREDLKINPTSDLRSLAVCSKHFVDGGPTFENPLPTLFSYNNYKQSTPRKTKNSHQGRQILKKGQQNEESQSEPVHKKIRLVKCDEDKSQVCYPYVSGEVDIPDSTAVTNPDCKPNDESGIYCTVFLLYAHYPCYPPVRTPGVKVENTSSVSPACRKRRLKGRRYIAIVADTA